MLCTVIKKFLFGFLIEIWQFEFGLLRNLSVAFRIPIVLLWRIFNYYYFFKILYCTIHLKNVFQSNHRKRKPFLPKHFKLNKIYYYIGKYFRTLQIVTNRDKSLQFSCNPFVVWKLNKITSSTIFDRRVWIKTLCKIRDDNLNFQILRNKIKMALSLEGTIYNLMHGVCTFIKTKQHFLVILYNRNTFL